MAATTTNVTLPGGEEFVTILEQVATVAAHTDHTAVNIDGGEIVFDGHLDNMLDIKKTLGNAQRYIRCRDALNNVKFSISNAGKVLASEGLEVGDMLDIEADKVKLYTHMEIRPEPNDDPATDVVIQQNFKQAPLLLKPTPAHPPPTLYTNGSIGIQGYGFLNFTPVKEGNLLDFESMCRFGSAAQIGDFTHENDGISLRKQMTSDDDRNLEAIDSRIDARRQNIRQNDI